MRGLPLILVALFIDGLQAILSLTFLALGSVLTAATPIGAAVGCGGAGFLADGPVTAVKSAIVCAIASPFGAPLGVALGFAVNICISATLGAGFVLLLGLCGYFGFSNWKYIMGGGMFELIPGLDILPGWTIMTVSCIISTNKRRGLLEGSDGGALGTVLAPTTIYGAGFSAVKSLQRQKVALAEREGVVEQDAVAEKRVASRQQLKGDLQNIDGITAPSPDQNRARTNYAV